MNANLHIAMFFLTMAVAMAAPHMSRKVAIGYSTLYLVTAVALVGYTYLGGPKP